MKHKTVLILGAGASYPYGFPSNVELTRMMRSRASIEEILRARREWSTSAAEDATNSIESYFAGAMKKREYDRELVIGFRKELLAAVPDSIDHFVMMRTRDGIKDPMARALAEPYVDIAQILMATILLECERKSSLADRWYDTLLRACRVDGMECDFSNLAVVTFNYDRSLKEYLLNTVRAAEGLTEDDAWAKVNAIPWIHVYGSLGPLRGGPKELPVKYGDVQRLLTAKTHFRLMGRDQDVRADENITKLLTWADRLIILGFGFQKFNCERLGVLELPRKYITMTTHGLHRDRYDELVKALETRHHVRAGNIRETINDLLTEMTVF